MDTTVFTICTPVHNDTNYLPYLFKSLEQQTYSNWNIVIVDDASKDEPLNYIQEQDIIDNSKVTTFRYERNVGPFIARKKALSLSKGDYILCIDADDELTSKDTLDKLNSLIVSYSPEVIMFNMTRDLTSNEPFIDYEHIFKTNNGFIKKSEILQAFVSTYSLNNLASKAIKRELFSTNEIKKHFVINEDRLEVFDILKKADSFYLTNELFYYYRKNETSTTESQPTIDYFEQITAIEQIIHCFAVDHNLKTNEELSLYLKAINGPILGLSKQRKWKEVKQDYIAISENAFLQKAYAHYNKNISIVPRTTIYLLCNKHLILCYLLNLLRNFINK